MEQLWAPWRLSYIESSKTPGCIFCNAFAGVGQERDNLVLYRDPRALVMLNRFPYGNGHLLVAPAAHHGDPLALPTEDYIHLAGVLRRAVARLGESYRPQGFNLGMNLGACAGAGIADHLHWHVVPRWYGDTNFMPVLADVRSMPEHLEATWERLRPLFAEEERVAAEPGRDL